MAYEFLSRTGFIQELKDVTTGTHPRKFCFVLGAGASRSSGIKLGQELVKIWDRDLRERNEDDYECWRKKLNITDANMSNFYSHYYEKRFSRSPTDGLNYIERIMESAKPSVGYVMLAYILTTQPHNVVITTNFDHLTEDAVTYYAQKTPLVIGHESLSRYINGQPTRPTIVKIHRDLLFDPKSRSEDLEKLPESWQNALERIFKNYHPVFIGYAGNDKSLMDFLIDNSEKFSKDQWKFPYWLLYKNDEIEGKVQSFLKKSEGIVVRYNGFDEIMIELGAAFDYDFPDKDKFLEDATERFNALKDAIDAFADKSNAGQIERLQQDNDKKAATPVPVKEDEDSEIEEAIEKITGQSEAQKMYLQANIYLKDDKFDEAIGLLNKLLLLEPNNLRYRHTLAQTLFYAKQYEQAAFQANCILEKDPCYALAHYIIGRIHSHNKERAAALESFRKALECDPERSSIHYAIGEELRALGDDEEALLEYHKAIELEPEWAMPHFGIGEILEDLEQYEDALNEYRIAAELDPEESLYAVSIGMILNKQEKFEEALQEYVKAANLSPDWGFCHYLVAQELISLNRYEEALIAINKAISVNPDNADAGYYYCLSSILYKLNRPEEAEQAADTARELEKTENSDD